jgi:exosome complex exonuclease RRP6
MDMIWLQRDFGIYVVGLFDTERAAVALRYPGRGLAYLLQRFINFQAQKQHQLADWRIRPLPKDLFDYARADTHFLLYVYDCMRNELIEQSNFSDPEQDLLQQVLDGSKAYQLQRYETPIYDAEQGMGALGWYKQLYRNPALLSKQQFAVYKALHHWRDSVARQEDDSIHFTMNNHTLMSLAREMPTTKEKLLSASSAQTSSMKQHQDELLRVVSKAKEEGENGPEMRDVLAELDKIALQLKDDRYAEKAAMAATNIINPVSTTSVAHPQPNIPPKRPMVGQEAIAVRSKTSQFWGSALGSDIQRRAIATDVRLALPLPELTAEIFADPSATTPVSQPPLTDPGARAEHAFIPASQRKAPETDDVFVIKELGGRKSKKRKLADAEPLTETDHLSSQADNVALEESSDQERKRRKAERKAAKKARKAALDGEADGANGEGADGEVEDEEHFDYDNAPSVLHAENSKESKEKRKKKGRDRGIDPYKKALDAPKGLPRAHREKAGKSATFK